MTERAISLPFSFDASGGVTYTTDNKKIIQDRVVLAVMTRFGERVMRPAFGSDVHSSTFENRTSAESIVKQAVASCFSKWFPDLELLDTLVKELDDGILEFEIKYSKKLQNIIETISIRTSVLTRSGDLIQEVARGK